MRGSGCLVLSSNIITQREKSLFYKDFSGLPGAIRTRDLSLRRRTLYPAELRRDYVFYCGHTVSSGKSLGAKLGAKSAKSRISGGRQPRKPRQFRPFFTRLSGETVPLGGERSILLSYGEMVNIILGTPDIGADIYNTKSGGACQAPKT